ncbi:hypothetical protein AJ80_08722 [Polytolypa hystricis UAMH7299]|uniref:Uncharacterized protein n=1 Tax=Polytolypa hystricis (strain UAMH7299) TaxID=1447883 RepID=A0A2B7X2I5_POLH7|nr:hypothetical protein AJ80_08722 [Polytolypa hystricis UAMH7299]
MPELKRKVPSAVFGVIIDFQVFRFVVLRENAKAVQSEPLQWATRSAEVAAFLDNILLDAIKSSPQTAPQKTANRTMKKIRPSFTVDIQQGEESGATGDEEEEEDDDDVFDVVKIDGVSFLRPHQQ